MSHRLDSNTWLDLGPMILLFGKIAKLDKLANSDAFEVLFNCEERSSFHLVARPNILNAFGLCFDEGSKLSR